MALTTQPVSTAPVARVVLRAFRLHGDPVEVGAVIKIPYALAVELDFYNKTGPVPAADSPADPPVNLKKGKLA